MPDRGILSTESRCMFDTHLSMLDKKADILRQSCPVCPILQATPGRVDYPELMIARDVALSPTCINLS